MTPLAIMLLLAADAPPDVPKCPIGEDTPDVFALMSRP